VDERLFGIRKIGMDGWSSLLYCATDFGRAHEGEQDYGSPVDGAVPGAEVGVGVEAESEGEKSNQLQLVDTNLHTLHLPSSLQTVPGRYLPAIIIFSIPSSRILFSSFHTTTINCEFATGAEVSYPWGHIADTYDEN